MGGFPFEDIGRSERGINRPFEEFWKTRSKAMRNRKIELKWYANVAQKFEEGLACEVA